MSLYICCVSVIIMHSTPVAFLVPAYLFLALYHSQVMKIVLLHVLCKDPFFLFSFLSLPLLLFSPLSLSSWSSCTLLAVPVGSTLSTTFVSMAT